jgi:hypothetical protein
MSTKRHGGWYKHRLGPQLTDQLPLQAYEAGFRRWLGLELHLGHVSVQDATKQFNIPAHVIKSIKQEYIPAVVPLGSMTEAEKKNLAELEKRVKLLERQLEDASIKNIALETLIDVAEQSLKIPIRKKPGAKQ